MFLFSPSNGTSWRRHERRPDPDVVRHPDDHAANKRIQTPQGQIGLSSYFAKVANYYDIWEQISRRKFFTYAVFYFHDIRFTAKDLNFLKFYQRSFIGIFFESFKHTPNWFLLKAYFTILLMQNCESFKFTKFWKVNADFVTSLLVKWNWNLNRPTYFKQMNCGPKDCYFFAESSSDFPIFQDSVGIRDPKSSESGDQF